MSAVRRVVVLSGGGAKGAFQCAALCALQAHGVSFDSARGVSVGALNAAGLMHLGAMRLRDVWLDIREQDVFRRYGLPKIAVRLLSGASSIYDHTPLLRTLERYLPEGTIPNATAGAVRLDTGEYAILPATRQTVWASAAIPLLFGPVDGYTDGGVREMTPLGEAMDDGADEIYVILCNRLDPEARPLPKNALEVAMRALELAMNEVARDDIRMHQRINDMVLQAAQRGVQLCKADGTPYRYVPLRVIEPPEPLGDSLDFSAATIRRRMRMGEEAVEAMMQEAA